MMEKTPFKDKNGNQIYAGDKLRATLALSRRQIVGKVIRVNDMWAVEEQDSVYWPLLDASNSEVLNDVGDILPKGQ